MSPYTAFQILVLTNKKEKKRPNSAHDSSWRRVDFYNKPTWCNLNLLMKCGLLKQSNLIYQDWFCVSVCVRLCACVRVNVCVCYLYVCVCVCVTCMCTRSHSSSSVYLVCLRHSISHKPAACQECQMATGNVSVSSSPLLRLQVKATNFLFIWVLIIKLRPHVCMPN